VAINLGNIVGNSVQGISSGLDTANIIKGLSAAKQKQIDNLKDTVTLNSKKISTFSDLKTSTSSIQTTANFLRNPPGILGSASNVFDYRKSSLSSSTLTVANYLNVTANPGAEIGNYSIEIGNLAKALEARSGSFNSRSTDATTPATGSYFTAGTFQIGSAKVQSVTGDTKTGDALLTAEYSVTGSGTGIVTADGIKNITVTGGSGGQTGLIGRITSSFTGSYNGGTGDLALQTIIDGVTYTANTVNANTVVTGGNGIASGTTFTFTADSGGVNETSFQITTASDVVINSSTTNVNTFLTNLKSGISSQSIYQSRQIENFVDANVKSPLTGLTSANIKFVSNSFDADTDEFGEIGGFTTQYSTGSNGAISVIIGDETFRVTGLGTSVNTNLTLQSTTTDKQLKLNLADAGVTISLATEQAAQAVERALDYSFGTRQLTDITVESGDSLTDVAFAINSQTLNTGVSATIVKVTDLDYRLSIKSQNVGIDNAYETFDTGGVLTNANISTTQAAEDAIISVDGVEIKRSTNSISDAIEDVTLTLLQETPDYGLVTEESLDLNIQNDIDTVVTTIQTFLNNYYDFRLLFAKQTERDAETSKFLDSAVLGDDTTLSLLSDQLSNIVTGSVDNVSDNDFAALTNIGISLDDIDASVTETTTDSDGNSTTSTRTLTVNNALIFDDTKLRDYLTENYDKVRQIFEFTFSADSSDIAVYKRTNSISLNEFKLDIDTSRATGQQIKILNSDGSAYQENGQDVYADYSAGIISGAEGTALEGLELIYAGDGLQTISISLSQGIADKVYNVINDYTKDAGLIDGAVESVNTSTDDTNSDITDLEDELEKFVASLQLKFNLLEQAISNVNNLLNYLTASDNARNNNN
jgi:flagellar hook-associated protein 2